MNGKVIKEGDKLSILDSNVFLTNIGDYQSKGYKYIIDNLRKKQISITTKQGIVRDMPSFENMESFGYTLLQVPLEALNIVYPLDALDDVIDDVKSVESFSDESLTGRTSSVSEKMLELTDKPSVEKSISSLSGGESNSSSTSQRKIAVNPHDLTGLKGLERIMDFTNKKTPPEFGSFAYKKTLETKYGRIFSKNEIGKYSCKIKNICDAIVSGDEPAEGVVLIYSQYIAGGLLPIALALEEMGFTRFGENAKPFFKTPPVPVVDARTMKPRLDKSNDFMPARYAMITGDPRISPNSDYDVKALTNGDNKEGNKIKVVLISKAGSEGLDFKFIRQVHILEPWYNMNRIEQIIGRAVRNFSHKDLPFEKRNVEIFMYGTLL
jgi:hypothetical protein